MVSPLQRRASSVGRPRSNERVLAVLDAACHQFSQSGFDGATMDGVAEAAGVTKTTVYSYFNSKENLFLAALDAMRERLLSPKDLVAGPTEDVQAHLQAIAARLLKMSLSRPAIGICRMLVLPRESAPHLGQEFWSNTVSLYRAALKEVLCAAGQRGRLAIPAPDRSVSQFFSAVTGDPLFRMLITSCRPLSESEDEAHAEAAVALFLAGHEPKQ